MAYANDYVLSILHKNKPVREFSENGKRTCAIPFDSEYKVRLKNKTSKRAKVKVYIDGIDIDVNQEYLVLNSNQTLDLERFIESLDSGKKLKFISVEQGKKTGEIQDPTSEDNGTIRVEFYPEATLLTYIYTTNQSYQQTPIWNRWNYNGGTLSSSDGVINGTTSSTVSVDGSNLNYNTSASNSYYSKKVDNETKASTVGATTEGSESMQKFSKVADFITEPTPTIIMLKIRGPKQQDELLDKLETVTKSTSDMIDMLQVVMTTGSKLSIEVKMNDKVIASTKSGDMIKLENNQVEIVGKNFSMKTSDYKLIVM